MSIKKCSKCLDEKPLDEFSINQSTPDGHEYHCKDCRKKRMKEVRAIKSGRKVQRITNARRVIKENSKSPKIMRQTPEQIISDLRRGLAVEVIELIRDKFGL